MTEDCDVISSLWAQLNPMAQIHGCEIDAGNSVQLYILYLDGKMPGGKRKKMPMQLCLGNPPKTVIRGLREAVRVQLRADRLSLIKGTSVVPDSEARGNSSLQEVGERDK